MSMYSGSSVYSSLDENELRQDRHALNQKLRRHQKSHSDDSTYDDGLDRDIDGDIENIEDMHYHDVDEDDDTEGIHSLQRAIRGENQSPSAEVYEYDDAVAEKKIRAQNQNDYSRKRHNSALHHYASRVTIPTNQSANKRVKSMFYLLLSMAIIISFGFFLVSCKLMTYGT